MRLSARSLGVVDDAFALTAQGQVSEIPYDYYGNAPGTGAGGSSVAPVSSVSGDTGGALANTYVGCMAKAAIDHPVLSLLVGPAFICDISGQPGATGGDPTAAKDNQTKLYLILGALAIGGFFILNNMATAFAGKR